MKSAAFAALLLLASPDAIGATAIRVFTRDPGRCSAGTIHAEPQCDGCAETRVARWNARDGVADFQLDLVDVPQWRVHSTADGCWSARVLVDGAAEAVTLTVWPAARFVAALSTPRGDNAPEALQLRVRSVREGEIPDAEIDCRRADDRWRCDVPATSIDVRVAPRGFVPHYLWGIRPKAGMTLDAGKLELRRGASISGRAAVPARDAAAPITVTLAPDAFTDTPGRTGLQTFTVTTNERGFFQLAGFSPGAWTITASRSGWSPAQTKVVVRSADETVLPSTLMLQPRARVALQLDPPFDVGGADWMVNIQHAPAWGVRLPIAESPSSDGRWQSDPVESGLYFITVKAADGTVVHRGGQMIEPGMAPLTIRIDRIVIRGTVTLTDEALEARLTFTDNAGQRIVVASDPEGAFQGAVSRRGDAKWSVEVAPKGSSSKIRVRNIRIEPVEGVATVSIDLPDGKVEGQTVDDSGQPVRASVRVVGKDSSAEATSAADGSFTVAGLAAEEVKLQAQNSMGDSGFVAHTVRGADDDPVTLVLAKKLKASITIETPAGQPYAGAVVRVITSSERMVEQVSSPAGRVPVVSPQTDPVAHVIVVAPGYPLAMRAVPLTGDDASRHVVLSRAAGRVLVPSRANPDMVIGRVGMPLLPLFAWQDPPPGTFRNRVEGGFLLELEAGEYRFCTDTKEQVCATRVVTPGSQQAVDFAPRAAQKEQP
ncbi:MAG TPA: hypothetical protein VNI54_06990 [Thermoanaerobaculia bacterium]|nr:hypothetical protein [Thermoanaerobaculia bacterium]